MSKEKPDGHRIVIVEDSATQALQLCSLLESYGLEVIVADNGVDGLQAVQDFQPAAVVLDLEMPGMNGLQVCQHIKSTRATKDIPVIMFTRHDDREAVILGLQFGAVEYIPKDTFANVILVETLRQMGLIID